MEISTDLSDLKGIHQGSKAFVLGAGPSLHYENLSRIWDFPVISTNSSILLTRWAGRCDEPTRMRRFWTSNDALCMRWSYFEKWVVPAQCVKIVRDSWSNHDKKIAKLGFRYFRPRRSAHIEPDDGGLCAVSSVPTAVDLALHMGCKEIYVLGQDHQRMGNINYFWQYWGKNQWPRFNGQLGYIPDKIQQNTVYGQNVPIFDELRRYAESLGAKLYNCSRHSKLESLEKKPLVEAFK